MLGPCAAERARPTTAGSPLLATRRRSTLVAMATRPAPSEPAPYGPPAPHVPPEAHPPTPRCANCDTPAGDAYCPRCGQEQHGLHRSMRSLVAEALDSLAGWDGKIPATLWLLVRHPGRLTTEFLAGRRARYLRPLRLYLTLSLVYFVTLNVDWSADGAVRVQIGGSGVDSVALRDSIAVGRADSLAGAATGGAPRRRGVEADTTTLGGRLERMFEQRVERFRQVPAAERNRAFSSAFFGQLPHMVFALVPLFALLLRVAYRRAPLFYAEHFVHALHLHAFAMLAMTVVHFTPGTWAMLPFLALPAYVWVALRRVYGGSRVRTSVKLTLVLGTYAIALVAAVSLMALVILFVVVAD